MVLPSSVSFFKFLNNTSDSIGVKTDVGSSIIKTFGSCKRALTISTLCFSPADKLLIGESKSNNKSYFFEISIAFSFNFLKEIFSSRPKIKFSEIVKDSNREKC